MKAPALRLAIVLSLASLSIVGRLALVWLPNVSLSFLALAVAGLAYGVRTGAAVGFLGRLGSDLLISGFNPILFPMTIVESLVGAGFGLAAHAVDVRAMMLNATWWTRMLLFDLGLIVTLTYSVAADSMSWIFYNLILTGAPDAARGVLWTTLVLMGLVFNVIPAIIHGLVFATVLPPLFRGLDASSLLRERRSTTPPNSVDSTEVSDVP